MALDYFDDDSDKSEFLMNKKDEFHLSLCGRKTILMWGRFTNDRCKIYDTVDDNLTLIKIIFQ